MKHKAILWIAVVAMVAAACGAGDDAGEGVDTTAATTTTIAATTTVGDATSSTSTTLGPGDETPIEDGGSTIETGKIEPGLEPLIAQAKADLATRLGVPEDAIVVRRAETVVWPDSSLGCPQPDMAYLQVLTEGSLIVLSVDGAFYEYHSGPRRPPFLCENPQPPFEAGGGDS